MKIQKNQNYTLNTFNGTKQAFFDCSPSENYWSLIGEKGKVLFTAEEKGFPDSERVLFQFEKDVVKMGLDCHNEVVNSLWILKSDLK